MSEMEFWTSRTWIKALQSGFDDMDKELQNQLKLIRESRDDNVLYTFLCNALSIYTQYKNIERVHEILTIIDSMEVKPELNCAQYIADWLIVRMDEINLAQKYLEQSKLLVSHNSQAFSEFDLFHIATVDLLVNSALICEEDEAQDIASDVLKYMKHSMPDVDIIKKSANNFIAKGYKLKSLTHILEIIWMEYKRQERFYNVDYSYEIKEVEHIIERMR